MKILQLGSRDHVWGRTTTYPTYICIKNLKFRKLKVLNINYINTDWSILFFFDLKDYISYCKDVYKYFNLSSVNFFVAGLKYRLFFSNGLNGNWSLYYFNITRLWCGNTNPQKCVLHLTVFCWDGVFYRFSKKRKKNL